MAEIDVYLTFDGNCAEAMRFYQRTLGGKLDVMTFARSPMADKTPPEAKDRVMHARLDLGNRILMASDAMAGPQFHGMHGFHVSLVCDTGAEGRKMFDTLAAGGKVTMPYEKTFWAEGFGMLVDRFGTPWMVNAGMQQQT